MGTTPARLTVLPARTVMLTGQPMANISDHLTMVNLAPFGLCRSLGFPATASATAAAQGALTPMPCMHNTPFPWMGGKMDCLVQNQPALLKSSKCQCMWGGTISIFYDGQIPQVSSNLPMPKALVSAPVAMRNYDTFNPYDDAQNHFNELKDINTDDLPISDEWKDIINAVKNNNYDSDGIISNYSEIEHAYNIYKLATNETAIVYGLDRLSDKTPYQLFEFNDEVPGFTDHMPKKEFWDSFDKFVPLYTDVGERVGYDPNYGCVLIPKTDKVMNRLNDSEWLQSSMFYHEYGHAYDDMYDFSNDSDFIATFNAFKREAEESHVKEKMLEEIERKGGLDGLNGDDLEKYKKLADTIQATSDDHEPVLPGSHNKEYYDNYPIITRMEFIAHLSENYWGGNEVYESLAPNTYERGQMLMTTKWRR